MVKKFTIPFASQGDANDIPDALQVDGKVSFTQGFGYDYERPYDDPQAKDIAREDMNGLFKAITSAVGELQTLGASEWSNAIAYPKGSIVYFEKDLYISQVDDNQNEPPQNWVSITSIANDSLKKVANLSDLTNKATARNNLGLGSSATLNKTDVLGTSTSLVATQKLVNDTKINLENSKQDKLEFVGSGKVMREGAFGLGSHLNVPGNNLNNAMRPGFYALEVGVENTPVDWASVIVTSWDGAGRESAEQLIMKNGTVWVRGKNNASTSWTDWSRIYGTNNTTTDKSGFLRASGSANALTETDRTSSLGTSTTLVATQKLVNDVNNRINDVPVDQIFYFESTTPPAGYIARNGQAINKSTMPKLYARYGANMPDDRDRYHRMTGNLAGAVGSTHEDAIQRIIGDVGFDKCVVGDQHGDAGAPTGAFKYSETTISMNTTSARENNFKGLCFDSAGSVRTATETRVKSRIVIFCNKIQ